MWRKNPALYGMLDKPAIQSAAREHGRSPYQISLRWSLVTPRLLLRNMGIALKCHRSLRLVWLLIRWHDAGALFMRTRSFSKDGQLHAMAASRSLALPSRAHWTNFMA